MSAAKEIVIVEQSKEHCLNARKRHATDQGTQMLRVPRTRTALQQ